MVNRRSDTDLGNTQSAPRGAYFLSLESGPPLQILALTLLHHTHSARRPSATALLTRSRGGGLTPPPSHTPTLRHTLSPTGLRWASTLSLSGVKVFPPSRQELGIGHTQARATYSGLCGMPACGQAVGLWCLRHAGALAWRRGTVCACTYVCGCHRILTFTFTHWCAGGSVTMRTDVNPTCRKWASMCDT